LNEDPMDQLRGHSMMCMDARMPRAHGCAGAATYRIALGPQQGRKVFTLRTLPDLQATFGRPNSFPMNLSRCLRAEQQTPGVGDPGQGVPELKIQRNLPALPHVAAQNGFDTTAGTQNVLNGL